MPQVVGLRLRQRREDLARLVPLLRPIERLAEQQSRTLVVTFAAPRAVATPPRGP